MVAPQNLAVLLQRIDCDVLGSGGINNPVFRHMMGALAADRTGSVAVGTAVTCRPPRTEPLDQILDATAMARQGRLQIIQLPRQHGLHQLS